jgi:decaprenylphospho-beta-D-ribofuranose 2-oxidase
MASPLSLEHDSKELTGWGRTAPSVSCYRAVREVADIQALIATAPRRGVLARGLGRSYGDAAQSGGAVVLDTSGLADFSLDAASGTVTAGAGASIDEILRTIVPAGFFVPVTPGTRMVTVGGAIAADVHGKNHHVDGTFGAHVLSLTLIDGNGALRTLRPSDADPSAFWATVGGMGLTGVITEATFDVIAMTSSRISVDTERARDLDDVMARMVARDDEYRYSVAWIDSVHASGRGVITRGDHAPVDTLPVKQRSKALDYDPGTLATAPKFVPSGLLNTMTVRAFNEAWYRKHPKSETGALQSIGAFFHPLDGVQEWNRIYGPRGFVQYQFVVPDGAADIVGRTLARLRAVGAPSFLTVLKRFGAANPAPLSFPQPGWTLAADIPAGIPGLADALDEIDVLVAGAGGRLYLAKDSRQSPAMFEQTYPRLAEWQTTRKSMDPNGTFTSDLGRRLGL